MRKILAIDIRTDSLSALLVKNTIKGSEIDAGFHVEQSGLLKFYDDSEPPLALALKQVIEQIDMADVETLVSVPAELISFRNLQVPFKDRKKIRQVLPFEIEPTLPFPIDELTYDFHARRRSEHTDIFAAVIQTVRLQQIVSAFQSIGIEPRIVTPGGLAAALCLTRSTDGTQDFVYIDIGNKSCSIFVVVSGYACLIRSFPARLSDPSQKGARLSENIQQIIAAFESVFNFDLEPGRIYYSGGGIDEVQFKAEMDRILGGVPVVKIDLLTQLDLNIRVSPDAAMNNGYADHPLALAAAELMGISAINFHGEHSVFKRYWEEYKNEVIRTGMTALFVFIIAMFNVLLDAHFLAKDVQAVNYRIASVFKSTFPDVTRIVDPVQQMRVRIAEARDKEMFAGELASESLNIDILNEISQLIPPGTDVEFTRYVRGDDNILITGDTDTFNAVDEIKGNLEKAQSIKNITITSANLEKSINRVQFKLKADLK